MDAHQRFYDTDGHRSWLTYQLGRIHRVPEPEGTRSTMQEVRSAAGGRAETGLTGTEIAIVGMAGRFPQAPDHPGLLVLDDPGLAAELAADPDTAPPVTVGTNMVPAVIIALQELPLTPNGKVYRQALLAPDLDAGTRDLPYVAPRDAIEIRLAEIWREALEITRIGRGDNFFDLGGHLPLLARMRSEPRAGRR